jgi:hypothetical protein
MNEDTICLLKECNAGCKMATDSMEQVMQYVENDELRKLIDKYNEPHIEIGEECSGLLKGSNKEEKDPSVMAKAFSFISTEVKLMMKGDSNKIAKIMMDGCNMGIQSLSEYINDYTKASKESIDLAKKLVKTEQDFMNDLRAFL